MIKKQIIIEEHVIDIDTRKENYFQPNIGICEKVTRLGYSPLIGKINQHIHDKDKNAYEPNILSIGPYYYGVSRLQTTQKMKLGYLKYLLESNQEKKLEDYLEAIHGLEKQARSCYENEVEMDETSFVKMLLLDGCFILLSCCGIHKIILCIKTSEEGAEKIINENKDAHVIDIETTDVGEEKSYENDNEQLYASMLFRDILLVENQIPFFIIAKIFEVFTGGRYPTSVLVENFTQHIQQAFDQNAITKSIVELHTILPTKIFHLLHLCHIYFKPSQTEVECCQNQVGSLAHKNWRGATKYKKYLEARMELKKREFCIENPHSLLDIKFSNGTLEIPYFTIESENCDILQNLIAFEQTYPHIENYITAYVVFLSQFITTPDDVALLVQKGIIKPYLHSDKEIFDLFRSLGDGFVDFSANNYLKSICHSMEEHYDISRSRGRELLNSITSKFSSLYRNYKRELPVRL